MILELAVALRLPPGEVLALDDRDLATLVDALHP